MTQLSHPLPIGTIIRVNIKSIDTGIMSWDDTDTDIERVAEAGSECHVWQTENGKDGYMYHVTFLPSEVWNILDEKDFAHHPEHFEIISLGDGTMASAYSDYFNDENRPRDPEAERKIAEELGKDGPSL
jgi:hypothetical protein